MPFSKGSVPPRLQGKGVPQNFVDMFIGVFNSVVKRGSSEGDAYRQAYGVMHKAMVKAGYRKGKDGKWTKGGKEDANNPTIVEEYSYEDIRALIGVALDDQRPATGGAQVSEGPYIRDVYPTHVVYEWEKELWDVKYALVGDGISLIGAPVKVQEVYVPTEDRLRTREPQGANAVLIGIKEPVRVLEENDKGLRFQGVALVDEAISQGGYGRYYSKGFNNKCMAATNSFMEQGGVVTVYSRHGKAIAPPGQLATGLPVGKVAKPLWREEGEVWYEALVAPTSEGKDVIVLIREEVLMASSIRAASFKSRLRKMGEVEVEEMLEAVIIGIDLCDEPGIEGAGIRRILEQAPTLTDVQEVQDMEWKDVTLEALRQNRADLIEAIVATLKTDHEAKLTGLQAKVDAAGTLIEEKTALVGKVDALTTQVATLGLQVKIEQAAQMGVSKAIAEELRVTAKSEADIAAQLSGARDKAFATILSTEADPAAKAKGKTVVEEEDDGEGADEEEDAGGDADTTQLTEERARVLHFAA